MVPAMQMAAAEMPVRRVEKEGITWRASGRKDVEEEGRSTSAINR